MIYEIVDNAQRSVRAKPNNKRGMKSLRTTSHTRANLNLVTFKYKEVSVNATALIQRQEDMDMIRKVIFTPSTAATTTPGAPPAAVKIYEWRLAPLVEAPVWTPFKKFWSMWK